MEASEIVKILKSMFSFKKSSLIDELERTGLNNKNFSNMDLSDINLEGIKINNCNFSGSNMQGSKLAGCIFTSCDFSRANMSDTVIGEYIDYSYGKLYSHEIKVITRFIDCVFSSANLSSTKFNSIEFRKCNFIRTNMQECKFYHNKWTDVNIDGCDFTKGLLYKAVVNVLYISESIIRYAKFDNCKYMNKLKIRDVKSDGFDVSGSHFTECDFIGQNMYIAGEYVEITDSKLTKMTMIPGSGIYSADIKNCDMRHINMSGTDWSAVVVDSCNLENAVATNINIYYGNPSGFHDSNLQNVDFSGSRLQDCLFANCNMNGVKFINVDMTDSSIMMLKTKSAKMKIKNVYICEDHDDDDFSSAKYKILDFNKLVKPENLYSEDYKFEQWKDVKHLIIK